MARLEAIFDATGAVLAAGGIEALSITAVASEVGIPAASVYDYVADSRSLLAAYVTHSYEMAAEALAGILVPTDTLDQAVEQIRTIFKLFLDLFRRNDGFRIAVTASQADDTLANISFADSKRNAAALEAMLTPFVDRSRHNELADRCLFAVHLSGPAVRMLLLIDEADAERMIETYISVFTDNITNDRR